MKMSLIVFNSGKKHSLSLDYPKIFSNSAEIFLAVLNWLKTALLRIFCLRNTESRYTYSANIAFSALPVFKGYIKE